MISRHKSIRDDVWRDCGLMATAELVEGGDPYAEGVPDAVVAEFCGPLRGPSQTVSMEIFWQVLEDQ